MFWDPMRKWESILFQKPFELCKLLIKKSIQAASERNFGHFRFTKIFIPHHFIRAHLYDWLSFYAETQHGMLTFWTCCILLLFLLWFSFMSDSPLIDDFFCWRRRRSIVQIAYVSCPSIILHIMIFNLVNENVAWIQIHVNFTLKCSFH